MIPAAILAGGRAERLGGIDKCLAPLGEGVVLDALLQRLAPQAAPIVLNSNSAPALFARFGLVVLPDGPGGPLGPLAGLLAALRWAASLGAAALVSVPGDTPFLPPDLVARLVAAQIGTRPVIAASDDGLYPVIGLWPVPLAAKLEAALSHGVRAVHRWAASQEATLAHFSAGPAHPFANINTAKDLLEAQRRFAAS